MLQRGAVRAAAAGFAAVLGASAALSAGAEFRQEGVSLHLLALPPNAAGRLRGVLEIALDPGWKTYWIDPGPVGLAPRLDFGRSEGLSSPPRVDYPVPVRFTEGGSAGVGYTAPTAFPFEAEATPGGSPAVRLDLLIGVCREICVPVQARLEATPASSLSARAAMAAAAASLPEEVGEAAGWRARFAPDGRSLRIVVPDAPGASAPADLFLAGPDGWSFGLPRRLADTETAGPTFEVPIDRRPAGDAALAVSALLTSGESARLSRSLPVERP